MVTTENDDSNYFTEIFRGVMETTLGNVFDLVDNILANKRPLSMGRNAGIIMNIPSIRWTASMLFGCSSS